MKLDVSTIVFLTGLLFVTQTIAVFFQYRVNKTYNGLGWWLAGAIVQALGFLLMLSLSLPSLYLLAILANPLVFLGQVFLAVGVIRFLDRKENRWTFIALYAASLAFYAFFIIVDNSILGRSLVVYTSSAIISWLMAFMLLRGKQRHFAGSAAFTACVFIAYGLLEAFSTVAAILLPPLDSYEDMFQVPIRTIPFIIPCVGSMLWTFGFIIMVNQRLNAENKEEKEKLRLIFDISPDAKMITRMGDGLFVDVNTGFLSMTGHAREEVVGGFLEDSGLWNRAEDMKSFLAKLTATGRAENAETLFRRKDGTNFEGRIAGRLLSIHDQPHCISVIEDITDRKRADETIRHMATHDGLTDLPTTRLFRDRLAMAMNMSRRNKSLAAVLFLDLDGFKPVNDTYGHDAGDTLLREVAERLTAAVRETDTVARSGGDEFLLVITEVQSPEGAAGAAEKILRVLTRPFLFKGDELTIGASIGISLFPSDSEDIDELIKLADDAMYRVKASGRNSYLFSGSTPRRKSDGS